MRSIGCFGLLQPQDWERGGAADRMALGSVASRRALGVSETQAKRLNRHLDRTRLDHDEGQPERQALCAGATPAGGSWRRMALRPRRRWRHAIGNSCSWRRRGGRSARRWGAFAGGRQLPFARALWQILETARDYDLTPGEEWPNTLEARGSSARSSRNSRNAPTAPDDMEAGVVSLGAGGQQEARSRLGDASERC